MKVNLFVAVYTESHKGRKNELDFCLNKNISNHSIDRVYILLEPGAEHVNTSEKEIIINTDTRVTYKYFFQIINSVTERDDINIIVNSDIFFESVDIEKIKVSLTHGKCFALARHEVDLSFGTYFVDRSDSQDSWCFCGPVRYDQFECDFQLGKPGCDNRIAHELKNAGYDISNPSKNIRSFHLHTTQVRTYERTPEHVVPPPYLRLEPII